MLKLFSVPIVFAINKIDKPNANPDKVKERFIRNEFISRGLGEKYNPKIYQH